MATWVCGLVLTFGLLVGCSGVNQAEVLTTPFPGSVLEFQAAKLPCAPEGCPFRYRVRISNPTDRNAHVQRCLIDEPTRLWIIVGFPAGLFVPAHRTRTAHLTEYVDLPKVQAAAVSGVGARCEGLDWHGDPPT